MKVQAALARKLVTQPSVAAELTSNMEYDEYLDGLPKLTENCHFCVREAKVEDSVLIAKIINMAFVEADAWFKKPEYHLRFDKTGERMKQYISESDRSRILVAETNNEDRLLVGAILLDWKNDVGHCTFKSLSISI